MTAFLILYGCMFASVRLEATVEQFIPAGCFAIPLMVLVPGPIAYWGFVILRRAGREVLKCPQCSTPCSAAWDDPPNLTQLTGNCAGCGLRLADVSVHEAPVAALPTASEYQQSATRHARSTRLGLFALIACLIALLTPLILILTDESIATRFLADMRTRYGPSGMVRALAITMLTVFAGTQGVLWAGIYVLHRIKKRRVRANPVLRCPHCEAELVRISEVVATRRCSACRKRVLAEPVGVAEESARG